MHRMFTIIFSVSITPMNCKMHTAAAQVGEGCEPAVVKRRSASRFKDARLLWKRPWQMEVGDRPVL